MALQTLDVYTDTSIIQLRIRAYFYPKRSVNCSIKAVICIIIKIKGDVVKRATIHTYGDTGRGEANMPA